MMDELFHYLDTLYPLSPELRATLVTRTHKEVHRKNRTVLYSGHICDWIAFIEKGLVKVCYDIPGGDERIVSFHKEGEIVCAVKSFISAEPSKYSIVSMDETIIRKIRKTELEAVCEKHPSFNVHLRKIIEKQSLLLDDHYISLTLTAKERLTNLKHGKVWILDDKRIKDYAIADYLGIDKATFSRYRNGH